MGYVRQHQPGHPRTSGREKRVHAHVLVVEGAMGKYLRPTAHIHHVNGDSSDNRNCNLVACDSCEYHRLLHVRQAALDVCGDPNWRKCAYCKTYDNPTNMAVHSLTKNGLVRYYHVRCSRKPRIE